MSARVIGLSGRKRSGKDTFALHLVKERGYARVAFADPLKRVAVDLDPIIGVSLQRKPVRLAALVAAHGWEFAKEQSVHAPEVRRFLQHLGTRVREHLGEDVWIDRAMREIHDHILADRPVVLTDVRFPNEAEKVRELGGWMVRVDRPAPRGLEPADLHVSETALDDYDGFKHTVYNAYDVDHLYTRADQIADDLHRTKRREDAAFDDMLEAMLLGRFDLAPALATALV